MIDANLLSEMLFDLDPANTCCKENDCFDEYNSFASSVLSEAKTSDDVPAVLIENFDYYFGNVPAAEMIEKIAKAIV